MEEAAILACLERLARLDIDAVRAYGRAIDAVRDAHAREQLVAFRDDHERHIGELSTAIARLGGEPPRRAPDAAWSGAWRLNLAAPAPRPVPTVDDAVATGSGETEQAAVAAPMPGTVIRVLVQAGARVAARQPLVVLEAMKMETPLVAPYEATVRAVHVSEGDRVAGGTVLVELDE